MTQMERLLRLLLILLLFGCLLEGCSSSRDSVVRVNTSKSGYAKSGGVSSKSSTGGRVSSELSSAASKLGVTATGGENVKLYTECASWLGVKYKYAGTSKSGVDCSGFTFMVYKAVYGKTISRQSGSILSENCQKISKSQLREGDLVFFRTDGKKSSTPNHVGIYLKNNKFIHSSSSKGVVVSDLTQDYYVRTWIAGGRVR